MSAIDSRLFGREPRCKTRRVAVTLPFLACRFLGLTNKDRNRCMRTRTYLLAFGTILDKRLDMNTTTRYMSGVA